MTRWKHLATLRFTQFADFGMSDQSAPPPTIQSRTSQRFNATSATLAFLGLGGWAWYVNANWPSATSASAAPWVSGLVQGTVSCLITLIMLTSVTWLFNRMPANRSRLFVPAVITSLCTGTLIVGAHMLANTSNIVLTVVPGLVIAFCFNVLTSLKLHGMR